MHQDDENDEYDDDDYDEDYYNYDYGDQYDPYKFYFTFNIDQSPLSDWLKKTVDDIINNNIEGFPVNSWNPNTDKSKAFQYLGSNYHGLPIWKTKYFLVDKLNNEYKLHLQDHVVHFVQQPNYYNGLYDILN
jgi:hypothetical protein